MAQYAPADGETIVLYSDGITEAENAAGEDYHEDRLARLLRERCEHDASALADSVLHDLNQFRGSHPASDDATLLLIRRRCNP